MPQSISRSGYSDYCGIAVSTRNVGCWDVNNAPRMMDFNATSISGVVQNTYAKYWTVAASWPTGMQCWGDAVSCDQLPPSTTQLGAVTAGFTQKCGIVSGTGSLWCSGTTIPSNVSAASWSSISAGWSHVCGILDSGSMVCWGSDPGSNLDIPADIPAWAVCLA